MPQFISQPHDVHQPSPLPAIPFELVREILLRLPVRSLLRFRCVCKHWKYMISDPHFAKLHLSKSTMDPALTHHRVLLPKETNLYQLTSCSVKSLFNNPSTPCEDVDYKLKSHKYRIVGSCYGLVCLISWRTIHVRLWNPSTQLASRKSPFMGYSYGGVMLYHGFGYDHVSDQYKVVFVFRYSGPKDTLSTYAKVYTFGDSSWKIIPNLNHLDYPTLGSGRFVSGSGTLNWVAPRKGTGPVRHVIHSFDLRMETFGEAPLPDFGDDNPINPIPVVLKDCLCICYNCEDSHLVVWLMKDYGVKESWTKLMAISHVELQVFGSVPYIEPLCVSETGKVLLNTNSFRAVVYNPRDDQLAYPHIQSTDKVLCTQYVYLESLVSPYF